MFPPELVDSVLSCHRDGSPTLRTCSLVCRDWHSLCTHYHMRTTTLRVTSQTLTPFLELIGSPHCTLLRWLRGIALPWSAEILCANLVDFEVLERIRLVDFEGAYTQVCGLPMLLGITSLHVQWARFASFTCFAALLANLPNLNKLTILNVVFAWSGPPPICVPTHSGQAPSLHLDSFELDVHGSSGDAELLEWLSSGADGSASICSHIRVHFLQRNAAEILVPYLNLLGNHLKSIHLISPYSESIPGPSLDFSRFSQLTTLRVASISLTQPVISTGLSNLWMRAVSQSRTLESLVLDVNTGPATIRRLTLHDVEPLASALRVVDSRIKRIQFNVCCEGHRVDVEGNLSPGHFDSTGSTGMGGTCEAETVFRAHVVDRLNLRSPEKCTLRLAELPIQMELELY
ncbi:hypothetical protein C8F01DRAFT_1375169 [Mycena amicta]|nr:hypothetical protein C8F01DRAFT_1375169 [Mycena amicta]